MAHLLDLFLDAAVGRFPPADGGVRVVPPPATDQRAIVAFTGHGVVAADVSVAAVRALGGDGLGGVLQPRFLTWLAGPDGRVGDLDVTLVGWGRGAGRGLAERQDLDGHPRVVHARRLRTDVRVMGDRRGLVTLGRGLAGRLELSVEAVTPGDGDGRGLVTEALAAVPRDEPVFAAVAAGNARSLRAFLTLGFRPVAAEVIVERSPAQR